MPEAGLAVMIAIVPRTLSSLTSTTTDSAISDNSCRSASNTFLIASYLSAGLNILPTAVIGISALRSVAIYEGLIGLGRRVPEDVSLVAITGQTFTDGTALQVSLSDRLDFLNTRFPSRTLAGQAPLVAHPEAQHSGRPYRLEWEEAMLDMQRLYAYLAESRWFRRTSALGQFSLGARRYGLGKDFANQTLEITFDAQSQKLICLTENGRQEVQLPFKGSRKPL